MLHRGERSVDMKFEVWERCTHPICIIYSILSRTCTDDLHEQYKRRKKRMLQEGRRADMSPRDK